MIINAKDMIAGRLASYAAKKALLGEEIHIVNSELAVITGNKKDVLKKYQTKDKRGGPHHGPFLQKIPYKFLKKMIRGMLTYKKGKGRDAYKRIKCYNGVPKEFQNKNLETIEKADVSKVKYLKYQTIGGLCNSLKQK